MADDHNRAELEKARLNNEAEKNHEKIQAECKENGRQAEIRS